MLSTKPRKKSRGRMPSTDRAKVHTAKRRFALDSVDKKEKEQREKSEKTKFFNSKEAPKADLKEAKPWKFPQKEPAGKPVQGSLNFHISYCRG